ncbi:hypothetical protein [Streptomyces sp. NPDC059092]
MPYAVRAQQWQELFDLPEQPGAPGAAGPAVVAELKASFGGPGGRR